VSEEIEATVDAALWREVEAAMRTSKGSGVRFSGSAGEVHRSAISTLARSCLNPAVQGNNVVTLKVLLGDLIGGAEAMPALAPSFHLGGILRRGIPSLFEFNVDVRYGGKKTDPADYRVYIDPGRFGLPSFEYYKQVSTVKAYVSCVDRCCRLLGLPSVSPAIKVEAALYGKLEAALEHKPDSISCSWASLQSRYPKIPWTDILILHGSSLERCRTTTFEVSKPLWLEALNAAWSDVSLELLALHALIHGLPYLPPPFDAIHSEFFERVLAGQSSKTPQRVLAMNTLKEVLPDALAYVYVRNSVPSRLKGEATRFVETIVSAAQEAIKEADWMSAAAKKEAARKVGAMELCVGYSEPKIHEKPVYPLLDPDAFLENIYRLAARKVDMRLARLEHGVPAAYWDEPPFSVNAYYYHSMNEIVIPAANFVRPFYKGAGAPAAAWNFGGLGAIIAHEITHAFDSQGQDINSRGRKRMWWSTSDRRGLQHRQRRLVDLYSVGGVNGKATLDENIADLGGLDIALRALHGSPPSKQALRDFFAAYAVSWRTKEKEEKKKQRLLADKHAPVEYRVNMIVSQFDEWYEAFGVTDSHALYRAPRSRIHLL
jgi:putative endopeptidase